MDNKKYVDIMIQSLERKVSVLKNIKECNKKQEELLNNEEVDVDIWDKMVDEKSPLIDEINLLDEGFDEVYERIKEDLTNNKEGYKAEIEAMKKLIGEITSLSMAIKAQEARNKSKAELHFGRLRKKGRTIRQSNRAAEVYNTSMKKLNAIDPQFLDRKN